MSHSPTVKYDPRSGNPRKTLDQILSRYRVLPNGCWEWTGARAKKGKGYGIVCLMIDGRISTMNAHRLQWMRTHGEIEPELDVCHNCPAGDNPGCINPAHLFKGTAMDNIHDMMAKGRQNFSGLRNQNTGSDLSWSPSDPLQE